MPNSDKLNLNHPGNKLELHPEVKIWKLLSVRQFLKISVYDSPLNIRKLGKNYWKYTEIYSIYDKLSISQNSTLAFKKKVKAQNSPTADSAKIRPMSSKIFFPLF